MSLAKGDHLVIKRGDKVLGPDDEAYHEFVVVDNIPSQGHVSSRPLRDDEEKHPDAGQMAAAYDITVQVVR